MDLTRIHTLEQTVVEAWPAAATQNVGPWLARASGGPTHRGNSVATASLSHAGDLEARLVQVEAFYAAQGRRPMLQVGPCAAPELDALLEARGYVIEGPALTQVAAPDTVLEAVTPSVETVVETHPSEHWLELAGHGSRFASSFDVLLAFLARLGPKARYVSARDDQGRVLATCLAVLANERVGVYSMLTREGERRRGAALSLLAAAARIVREEHALELYLQVETGNAAARTLYARAGFETLYAYHYRAK